MNLRFTLGMRKPNLVEEAGLSDEAKVTVRRFVGDYGHDVDVFSQQIRAFFFLSQDHYNRLAYRDALARWLDLDMTKTKDRDALWEHVVREVNQYRGDSGPWKTGQEDMDLAFLQGYVNLLAHTSDDFNLPDLGEKLRSMKLAIARSITFIRLFPPLRHKRRQDLPDAELMPEAIEKCWRILRGHPHYRNSRPATLNQHALDSVESEAKGLLWLETEEIGLLMRSIEGLELGSDVPPWFWPYVIFKHATRCKVILNNYNTRNLCRGIWNREATDFHRLWS